MGARPTYPRVIRFEGAEVRIARRANGMFTLRWRENGAWQGTTRSQESDAVEWAQEKAKRLALAMGSQWVRPGEAEALATLRQMAGDSSPEALARLLADARAALEALDGKESLARAARWFAEHGPLGVQERSVAEAVTRFLGEYEASPRRTVGTLRAELEHVRLKLGDRLLTEIRESDLRPVVDRRTRSGPAAPRTVRNRILILRTFLNRTRAWGWLPPTGATAADHLKRPRLPDAGREILSVDQGAALLEMIRGERAELEVYVLIGGWIGLRPSEIQRLRWEALDFARGYVHVCPRTAAKTAQERFVPIPANVAERLQWLRRRCTAHGRRDAEKVSLHRAREFISILAREKRVLDRWPGDVLRHSFCSYRLAVTRDIGQVAEEAGNSPAIIRSNYRRPVTPEEGTAWFALVD